MRPAPGEERAARTRSGDGEEVTTRSDRRAVAVAVALRLGLMLENVKTSNAGHGEPTLLPSALDDRGDQRRLRNCWIKVKNPDAPAVRREAEEDWV